MTYIIVDQEYDGQVRRGTTYKDGRFIRDVDIHDRNELRVVDTEGHQLWGSTVLVGLDFIIQTIDADTSSFGVPHIVLTCWGFTPGTNRTRKVKIITDWIVAPPEF